MVAISNFATRQNNVFSTTCPIRIFEFHFSNGKMTSSIWRETFFWSYDTVVPNIKKQHEMGITNLKKNLEYLIVVKSYVKLSVQFKAIFSNKMAENSNFRNPKLLIQFRYFKSFFSFVILKVCLFKKM